MATDDSTPKTVEITTPYKELPRLKDERYIYVLIDRASRVVWYVGQTANPKSRLPEHLADARRNRHFYEGKIKWILDLLQNGDSPELKVIEVCSVEIVRSRESYWIDYYKNINPELFNLKVPTKYRKQG